MEPRKAIAALGCRGPEDGAASAPAPNLALGRPASTEEGSGTAARATDGRLAPEGGELGDAGVRLPGVRSFVVVDLGSVQPGPLVSALMVPERAKIAASETLVPHVSNRPDAYALRLGVCDAEFLLFSLAPAAAGDVEGARDALASGRFGVLAAGRHFVLARRGHETAGNPRTVEYLSRFVANGAASR